MAPTGVYFSGNQLTIMAWVKVRSIQKFSRLIDFGISNGSNGQNEVVFFSLSDSTNGKPYIRINSGNQTIRGTQFKQLDLNKWKHLAWVFSFPFYSIFIDGVEVTEPGSRSNLTSLSIKTVVRNSNFIGRSNYPNDKDADADIDDLKFFNRALIQSELIFEMNNSL